MKKIVFCTIVAAIFTLAACDLPTKPAETASQYDAAGNKLVTLSLNVGGAGRALTNDLAKAGVDFYEVVFNNSGIYYRASWTKSQKGKISLATGYDYGGADKAILFAGTARGKTLLAVGLLTGSDGSPIPTFIDDTTTSLTFSLTALTTDISSSGTDTTFKITAPSTNATPSGGTLPTALEKNSFGLSYKVPVFMVPSSTSGVKGTFTWSTSDNAPQNYFAGMHVPDGATGLGTLQSAGIVIDGYGPITITPTGIAPSSKDAAKMLASSSIDLTFTTPAKDGMARIFFSQPVYALNYEADESIQWNISGGLNNDILDGGSAKESIGGSILLGIGAVHGLDIVVIH